jgi:membrane protease YdiL (CAAX protease family)
VSPWYYLFALGFPVLLYGTANGLALLLGAERDLSLMDGVLPTYAATWGSVVFLGGLEEPGWRGFAQPHLQQRLSPVRATLLIGIVWGLWHLPVSPLAIVVTVPLAFFYAWLVNRTGSVLLCLLLHASITPAQEHLRLTPDNTTLQASAVLTLVACAVAFVIATQGRLGSRVAPERSIES